MSPPESGPSGAASPDLPHDIGGYAVQRVLGTGGMATVYAALQHQPRRTVAIKVMRETAGAQAALHRFRREIEILGRLRHPFIAQVFDAGMHRSAGTEVPYFVMEYVPGARSIIEYADERKLDVRQRLKLFVKVCSAVEHGHRLRIIHRDLKPGNILIGETGDPKIIDYGVARAVAVDVASQTMHTEEGRLIGTIRYMAPEQLDTSRRDLDARCDVYALGVLLYRMLTGAAPHKLSGLPIFTAAQVIREDDPAPPSSINPEFSGDLDCVIMRALSRDRDRRYRTAGSLGRDLLRFLAHQPIRARGASRLYRLRLLLRRRPAETRAAAIVLAVVAVAAAVVLSQRQASGPSVPDAAVEAAGPAPGNPPPGNPPGAPPTEAAAQAPPPAAAEPDPADPDPTPEPPPEAFDLADGHAGPVTALVFGPAGRHLASAGDDHQVVWWDLEDRRAALRITDHDASVRHLAFSRDGSILASADDDGRVVLVAREGDRTRLLRRADLPGVLALALSPAGDLAAVACPDMTLRLVRQDGRPPVVMSGTTGAFRSASFSPDGTLVAAGSDGGSVYLWETIHGARRGRLAVSAGPVVAIRFDPDGKRLVAVDAAGTWWLWPVPESAGDLLSAGWTATFNAGAADPPGLTADPEGRWLLLAVPEGVRLMDLRTGRRVGRTMAPRPGLAEGPAALAPGAGWYAVGRADGSIHFEPLPRR